VWISIPDSAWIQSFVPLITIPEPDANGAQVL
jgi:hypothetical protein